MDTGAGGRSGDAFSCATSYIDQGTQPWPVQVLRIYGRELQTSTTISMLADDILLEHLTSVETTTWDWFLLVHAVGDGDRSYLRHDTISISKLSLQTKRLSEASRYLAGLSY